jgi:hypothetical protein
MRHLAQTGEHALPEVLGSRSIPKYDGNRARTSVLLKGVFSERLGKLDDQASVYATLAELLESPIDLLQPADLDD